MLRCVIPAARAAADAQPAVNVEARRVIRRQILHRRRALPRVALLIRVRVDARDLVREIRLVGDERKTRHLVQRIEELLRRILRLERGVKAIAHRLAIELRCAGCWPAGRCGGIDLARHVADKHIGLRVRIRREQARQKGPRAQHRCRTDRQGRGIDCAVRVRRRAVVQRVADRRAGCGAGDRDCLRRGEKAALHAERGVCDEARDRHRAIRRARCGRGEIRGRSRGQAVGDIGPLLRVRGRELRGDGRVRPLQCEVFAAGAELEIGMQRRRGVGAVFRGGEDDGIRAALDDEIRKRPHRRAAHELPAIRGDSEWVRVVNLDPVLLRAVLIQECRAVVGEEFIEHERLRGRADMDRHRARDCTGGIRRRERVSGRHRWRHRYRARRASRTCERAVVDRYGRRVHHIPREAHRRTRGREHARRGGDPARRRREAIDDRRRCGIGAAGDVILVLEIPADLVNAIRRQHAVIDDDLRHAPVPIACERALRIPQPKRRRESLLSAGDRQHDVRRAWGKGGRRRVIDHDRSRRRVSGEIIRISR